MKHRVVETVNSLGSCVYKIQRKYELLPFWYDQSDEITGSYIFNTREEAVSVITIWKTPESSRVVYSE